MSTVLTAIATCGAICILVVGPIVWIRIFQRLARGEPILPQEPRRLACWGFIDALIFVVLMVLVVGALSWAGQWLPPTAPTVIAEPPEADSEPVKSLPDMRLILLGALAQMVACLGLGLLIVLRTGCKAKDLGISIRGAGRDIGLGGAAFCALAIPTFLIQSILTTVWKSEHPLIKALEVAPSNEFLAIASFVAVVSAPLTEEFLFRVLLQGWLERLFDPWEHQKPGYVQTLLLGESMRARKPALWAEVISNDADDIIYLPPSPLATASDLENPYAPSTLDLMPRLDSFEPRQPSFPESMTDALAISVSASVFALLHFSHGPDWIALFFLALGLGYLYRRTHRIMPSLVVHFLLNGLSMVAMTATILKDK